MKSLLLLLSLVFLTWQAEAVEPEWNSYKEVLKHVKPGVKNGVALMLVDYERIKVTGRIEMAYKVISNFNVARLENHQEKLSFYINAYNILALKMVADHWPIKSIKDIGPWYRSVWNETAGKLGGEAISLGEVEHKILRLMNEPRIHFAIVCASVSCPNLRLEPYTATKLNQQLNDQVQQFLSNQGKGLKVDKKIIHISKIFDWFEDDFKKSGGIDGFINHYRPELSGLKIVKDIEYDWSVNSVE